MSLQILQKTALDVLCIIFIQKILFKLETHSDLDQDLDMIAEKPITYPRFRPPPVTKPRIRAWKTAHPFLYKSHVTKTLYVL